MKTALVLRVAVFSSCSTLCSHEVRKVPDEFTNDVLLPLLVEHFVVVFQDDVLVLFSKHHGGILQREKAAFLILPSATNMLRPMWAG